MLIMTSRLLLAVLFAPLQRFIAYLPASSAKSTWPTVHDAASFLQLLSLPLELIGEIFCGFASVDLLHLRATSNAYKCLVYMHSSGLS